MTANAELAGRAIALAPGIRGAARSAALCAAVALRETRSVTAARKVLAQWDGPADIKAAAADVIGQLEREEP